MSTTWGVPAGIHRRVALAVGLGLVRWAQRRPATRGGGSGARCAVLDREAQIRRYEAGRQVERDRDRALALAGLYTHRVM